MHKICHHIHNKNSCHYMYYHMEIVIHISICEFIGVQLLNLHYLIN